MPLCLQIPSNRWHAEKTFQLQTKAFLTEKEDLIQLAECRTTKKHSQETQKICLAGVRIAMDQWFLCVCYLSLFPLYMSIEVLLFCSPQRMLDEERSNCLSSLWRFGWKKTTSKELHVRYQPWEALSPSWQYRWWDNGLQANE